MKVYLKVKIKSLAAEAHIIRREEKRHRGEVRAGLHFHRIGPVRNEARATLLAYGFLRGRPLALIEPKRGKMAGWMWEKVEAMVKKYGDGDQRDRMQRFSEWKSAA